MKIVKKFDRVIDLTEQGAGVSVTDTEKIRPEMKNRIERPLITRRLIAKRVKALAKEVAKVYKNERRLQILYILEGATMFSTDLAKEIYNAGGPEIRSQSIKARTYGDEIKAQGEDERQVHILYVPSGLEGKKVLLVEDIVDQGFTLEAVKKWLLRESQVAEVRICALLDKQLANPRPAVKSLRKRLELDWVGFTIPDRWVAGYGIDAGDDFRFLPFIVIIREAYYQQGGK